MSESPETRRERERKKAAAFRARGLTSKGKPRKGPHKPNETQREFVIDRNDPEHRTFKRRPPTMPKKGETEEQRLARGRSVRGTPMARKLDESIQRRLKAMRDD